MGGLSAVGAAIVGREREVRALDAALTVAATGQRRVLIVEGGWGTGKSTLIDHAVATAHDRDFTVALSRGAVRDLIADVDPSLEAGPVLVCVDDAHLLDDKGATVLLDLLANSDGQPCVLVLAGDVRRADPWTLLRAEASRLRDATFLALQPLDVDAVSALTGDDATFAHRLHRWTGGNAFLLAACLEHARTRDGATGESVDCEVVPDVVRHRVESLLRELELPARWLIDAAAVDAVVRSDNDPSIPAVLMGVAGLHEVSSAGVDVAGLALDQLLDIGLVSSRDLRFAAPVVAHAIAELLPGSRREQLHSALANALWSAGAPNRHVAAHLRNTTPGRSEWAVDLLRSSARDAAAEGDRTLAVDLLRRALEESPAGGARVALLDELALAEAAAGEAGAVERLAMAVAAQPSPDRGIGLQYAAGRALLAAGRANDAATVFQKGLDLAPGGAWHRLFEAGLLEAARLLPELWRSMRAYVPALVAADREPLDAGARAALAELSFDMATRNEPAVEVADLALRALPAAESATVDDPALVTAVGVLVYAGEIQPALTVLDAALAKVDARSGAALVAGLRHRLGQCKAYQGDLAAAYDELSFALATEKHGWAQLAVSTRANLARVLVERGDLAIADRLIGAALDSDTRRGVSFLGELYAARGLVRLAQRRVDDALAAFRESGRCAVEVFECRNPAMLPWRSGAAIAAHRSGATEAARRLAEDELQAARRFGERRALARALRVAGLLARDERGIERLREALAVIEPSSAALERAHVLADLGGALRRAGRTSEAKEHLAEAGDLADRLGAAPLAARVAASMRLAGARPRRLRISGPLALTPGEARVARLAAAGATNREIASELFVTTKAVEYHLSNAYRKLGIRSRRELPAALADDSSPEDGGRPR